MPDRVKKAVQQTKNRFLNLYELEAVRRDGSTGPYFVASRAKDMEHLKALNHENNPDGIIIYSVYGERKDHVVLIRQFRYPINDYVYEFPAGLVESGESMAEAGIREIFEETGLTFTPKCTAGPCTRPFFTTVGMTDESCGTIYGYCTGKPSNSHQERTEDIQIVLADRDECRRILKEERVAIMCAYMLMHFINTPEGEDPLRFLDVI
ncbi:MAG: NUDIX hydrolase [Parasporobacterium sp.]|nr:NUDIX hydrolase [Parasporobacterium sp.]